MITSSALRDRLLQVAVALDIQTGGTPQTLDAAVRILTNSLPAPSTEVTYLLLAATSGTIPQAEEVITLERQWRLTGTADLLTAVLERAKDVNRWRSPRPIRIESGIIVDVHDTAHTPFTTGIQRVVRSTLAVWLDSHDPLLITWTSQMDAPRTLTPAEYQLATGRPGGAKRTELIIPFRGVWILPEISTAPARASRVRTIALFAGEHTAAIGYDAIPITSAETAGPGMPGRFAGYLATLAQFDRVAPISDCSQTEYRGIDAMLRGAGIVGPNIDTIALPTVVDGEAADEAAVRRAGIPDGATLVLAVGSHEPRKNHLAVLQAAELAWRAGHKFTLAFVGGNSWARIGFDAVIEDARRRGRSIVTLSAASDPTVLALYRRARFTVFPSINEGFGLPVVESISEGTPVITSDFGSMRESAEGKGGLLVDPRDDHALAAAIEKLLTDDKLLAKLRAQAAKAPVRTWETYANELWAAFVPAGFSAPKPAPAGVRSTAPAETK